MAGRRPPFQAPFPCGQTWDASTYNGHWPNQNSIDLARRDSNRKNISKGEPVLASADGIVMDVFTTADGENRIYIDHGDGWVTHYIHHEQIPRVNPDQFVAQGEQIGVTSNTGAEAVHIHYTQLRDNEAIRIWFNGKAIDTHAGNPNSIGTWGSDNAEKIKSRNCPPEGRHYVGVFREGSGAHALWLNDQREGFISKWKELSSENLRLISLKVSTQDGKPRYSGIFSQGSGGYALWLDDSRKGFLDKWTQLSSQNLRLIDLEITGEGGERRYSGVFGQGSGGYALWLDDSREGFIEKWKQLSSGNLRLIDLEISGEGTGRRYSGVFRQESGGHALWLDATWDGFETKWKELSGKGLRLIDLEMTGAGNQRRFSGVFREGAGGYGLWSGNYSSFMNTWLEWSRQGLRLVDFETA
jgi:murein DD-endopeptidase MepM/ murein hydrolase activator NlpD